MGGREGEGLGVDDILAKRVQLTLRKGIVMRVKSRRIIVSNISGQDISCCV